MLDYFQWNFRNIGIDKIFLSAKKYFFELEVKVAELLL